MNGPTSPEIIDALEGFERQARDIVEHRPEEAAWDQLVRDLQATQGAPSSALNAALPLLDPDEARKSSAELLRLIEALRPLAREPVSPPQNAATPTPSVTSRAGYAIEGRPGSKDARVRPSFAEALARRVPPEQLRSSFPDLWTVDFKLWKLIVAGATEHSALALAWLVSPGRRLIQDLTLLRHAPRARTLGASDFSPESLRESAGPSPASLPDEASFLDWRELHAAVPGTLLDGWCPATEDVSAVLRILEGRRGDPVFIRGAALAWILDRAASQPFYQLDGIDRDLREDLVPVLAAAFPAAKAHGDDPRHAELRTVVRLETAALHHAASLGGQDHSGAALARCWGLARWLQSCSFRSPFYGGDEEALAARLRALLPTEHPARSGREDVLDPSRFLDDGTGLDLAELTLVAGATRHYWPEGTAHPQLFPTPLPLVNALRRIASRTLNTLEQEAEVILQDSPREPGATGNALGWKAHHIAPPLVARWLMTHHRIAWLRHVPIEASEESLRLFGQAPRTHEWVAFAVYTEGPELAPEEREVAARSWRAVVGAAREQLKNPAALPLMAAGILDQLSPDDTSLLPVLIRAADVEWRHQALEALAVAAERWQRSEVWGEALNGLLGMADNEQLDARERLKATLLALRRLSASSRSERFDYLHRLATTAARPPFNQNVALRRELRRLGVASPDPRGGR